MNLKGKQYRFIKNSVDRLSVNFEKDHLKEVTSKQNTHYQLELIENGKLGYASSNYLNNEELIDKASRSAEFGDKVDYDYPKITEHPKVELYSQGIVDTSPEELIKLGENLIEAIKEVNPDILVDVRMGKVLGQSHIENSSGFEGDEKETAFNIMLDGELVSEGDILTIGDFYGWRENGFHQDSFTKKIKKKFKLSEKIVPFKSKNLPVIFTPESLTNILEPLFIAMSAYSVYKSTSKWVGKLGKKLIDQRISIIDDPTVNFALNSTQFDDEGLGAQSLYLIENGTLKNYYTDLKSAEKLKISPNGRGFGIPANPDLTNIKLSPGSLSTEELIKNTKEGILVDQVIGGGQDSPYTGDFTLQIHLGYLIKNGELVGRIKNCVVSGNAFEIFRDNLGEISSDLIWYEGSMLLPHVLFENMKIVSQS